METESKLSTFSPLVKFREGLAERLSEFIKFILGANILYTLAAIWSVSSEIDCLELKHKSMTRQQENMNKSPNP